EPAVLLGLEDLRLEPFAGPFDVAVRDYALVEVGIKSLAPPLRAGGVRIGFRCARIWHFGAIRVQMRAGAGKRRTADRRGRPAAAAHAAEARTQLKSRLVGVEVDVVLVDDRDRRRVLAVRLEAQQIHGHFDGHLVPVMADNPPLAVALNETIQLISVVLA